MRNVASIKYSMHPDPGRPFYKDNTKLSTFASSGSSSSSPRIIVNPCDVAYESTVGGHRSDTFLKEEEANHYLVSEELCKLPMNNFNTDLRGKGHRQELPMRYNMSFSNEFNNGGVSCNGRRLELNIHHQFVKSKVPSKKSHNRPSISDFTDSDSR